jgi:hypothetical protein
VLDLEHWQRTPITEQRHPGQYVKLAAQIAHQQGLLLLVDPATNLVLARAPKTPLSQQYAKFISLRIAASSARYADVYEIDARGSATSGPGYASFVQAAGAQALSTAPDVTLLASLSSGSGRGLVAQRRRSPNHLLSAALATRSFVSGYQLNDLRGAGRCAGCRMSPAAMATTFLRSYRSAGG